MGRGCFDREVRLTDETERKGLFAGKIRSGRQESAVSRHALS